MVTGAWFWYWLVRDSLPLWRPAQHPAQPARRVAPGCFQRRGCSPSACLAPPEAGAAGAVSCAVVVASVLQSKAVRVAAEGRGASEGALHIPRARQPGTEQDHVHTEHVQTSPACSPTPTLPRGVCVHRGCAQLPTNPELSLYVLGARELLASALGVLGSLGRKFAEMCVLENHAWISKSVCACSYQLAVSDGCGRV